MRVFFGLSWFLWGIWYLFAKGLAHGALALIVWSASSTLLMPGYFCAVACSSVLHFELASWLVQCISLLFWVCPTDRIKRWFGTFDPFPEPTLMMPSIMRGLAAMLDWLRRLKAGRGKMGGWA